MIKKSTILTMAIAIIFVFFVGYGIEAFYPSPSREDVCSYESFVTNDASICEKAGGTWRGESISPKPEGYCDAKVCYDKFSLLEAAHNKIVFIVSVLVGLLAFGAAYNLKQNAVSTGVVGGSLLLILYGTMRYWRHANSILKFVLLGVALAGLIWFAYKKLK